MCFVVCVAVRFVFCDVSRVACIFAWLVASLVAPFCVLLCDSLSALFLVVDSFFVLICDVFVCFAFCFARLLVAVFCVLVC